MSGTSTESRRPLLLLSLGALVGVAAAAWSLLGTDPALGSLPSSAVARVNGSILFEEDHARLVAGLENDLRQPVTAEMKTRVLDRMIDEELLVQRGIELGLVESDRRIRGNITSAMIRSIVVEAEDETPTEAELERFYEEESSFFAQPGRLRVRQIFFRVGQGQDEAEIKEKASQAKLAWEGGAALTQVRQEFGDREVSPIPDALLPPAKLREYIGPTALRAVSELSISEIGEPVRSGTGIHVFRMVDKEDKRVPGYGEVSRLVRNEWVRRAGDRALRTYLDDLRDRADVITVSELP